MNIRNIFRGFLITLAIGFVVCAVVTYLYSLIVHGEGIVDWETAFRLGLILGITLPIVHELERKRT